MSLYINLINESLEDDRKADLEVLARLKRNYIDNRENAKPQVTLDTIQINLIKKNFNIFERQIYKLLGYIEQRKISQDKYYDIGEVADLVSNIILSYNGIVAYLQNVGYNKLFQGDKQFIDKRFAEYIASLKLVQFRLEKEIDPSILAPLSDIIDNIQLKNYKESGYALPDLIESAPRRQEKQKISKITKFIKRYNTKAKIRGLSAAEAKRNLFELTGTQATNAAQAKQKLLELLDTPARARAQAPVPVEEEEEDEEPEEQTTIDFDELD